MVSKSEDKVAQLKGKDAEDAILKYLKKVSALLYSGQYASSLVFAGLCSPQANRPYGSCTHASLSLFTPT